MTSEVEFEALSTGELFIKQRQRSTTRPTPSSVQVPLVVLERPLLSLFPLSFVPLAEGFGSFVFEVR